jgi:hypothetical protein
MLHGDSGVRAPDAGATREFMVPTANETPVNHGFSERMHFHSNEMASQ